MATYVIGDIHGQLEQLKVLLEKMKFNENDELYVMGDVVDRAPIMRCPTTKIKS